MTVFGVRPPPEVALVFIFDCISNAELRASVCNKLIASFMVSALPELIESLRALSILGFV